MTNKEQIEDIQSFPVLTSEVSRLVARRPGAPGAPLGQTVEQALYETLGWRPRISDPKGFVAALTQSFIFEEKEGQEKWIWMPHIYTVQADLGAVTGAQASIYKQATVIRNESLPLLQGLKPLKPCYDEEDTNASRAIVESSLSELVDELGLVGGPRVQRVDTLFSILLNLSPTDDTPDEPEKVKGQLGSLRGRFGLERKHVNTIEEEQNLTNYLVVVDYILSLRRGWKAQRHFFDRKGTDVYLGTQVVLLARALNTLTESVYEAYDAMDSVFLGEAERQSIDLSLEGEDTTITIAELLAWAERFGSEEGRRLINEGGKEGVRVMRPTIDRLRGLLRRAWELSEESPNPVKGFHTPRVRRTFQELTVHSDKIYYLVSQIDEAPLIDSIDPDAGRQGEVLGVTIKGKGFDPAITDAGIGFGQGIATTIIPPAAPDKLDVEVTIHQTAAVGFRDVTVTNPDGKSYTKNQAFNVIESGVPSIDSIDPDFGRQGGKALGVTIKGKGFDPAITDAGIGFGQGIATTIIPPAAPDKLDVEVTIHQTAAVGFRDVTVTNPDGRGDTKENAFLVIDIVWEQKVVAALQKLTTEVKSLAKAVGEEDVALRDSIVAKLEEIKIALEAKAPPPA